MTGTNSSQCVAAGCCWQQEANGSSTPWCFFAASCAIPDSSRADCGYSGINQQMCEAKGCCWGPIDHPGPWCFFPNTGAPVPVPVPPPFVPVAPPSLSGAPYSDEDMQLIRQFFLDNINVDGSGAVVASPSTSSPDYYYHWTRDAAISMLADMLWHNHTGDSSWVNRMRSYIRFETLVHTMVDPSCDVRGEPKFYVPTAKPYDGGWCRPQDDGPGLRAGTLARFAMSPLGAADVQAVWAIVASDLAYVVGVWQTQATCDLWEEVRSNDFFWTRLHQRRGLLLGAQLARQLGHQAEAAEWDAAAKAIAAQLPQHVDASGVILESQGRPLDTATICAINDGYADDGFFSPLDRAVQATVANITAVFHPYFAVNAADDALGINGTLVGRYPGDTYYDGNPWILNSQCVAELRYQQGVEALRIGRVPAWSNARSPLHFAVAALGGGDDQLRRVRFHVARDGLHMAEQLDKSSGKQLSARDLTWSYGTALKAMVRRAALADAIAAAQP